MAARKGTLAAELRRGAQEVAGRDRALLLGWAWGLSREELFLQDPAQAVPLRVRRRYARLLGRRRRGEPVAYLTGRVAFWDMDLEVGPGVLIPRPETEVLVEAVVDRLRQANWPCPVVVDLGTGSGNVALAIAREVPWAQVWATDLSPRAVWVARRNAQRWAPQVKVLPPGDLAQPLRRRSIRAHVAVMNPPYIPTRHLSRLAREVRREPRLALDGGPDGLSVVRRLVASVAAGEVLVPGGELWMEIGFDQAQRVEEILTTQLGGPVIWHRDLAGILRVVGVRWQPLPGRGHP